MTDHVIYGNFDDSQRAYVVTNPLTPKPWINYLSNRKLATFISQNAGGFLWCRDTTTGRITRYHYLASPSDRPGYYVYVKDHATGKVWNPHFAPTCTELDDFKCYHMPGTTRFVGVKDGIEVSVQYVIPPDDNALLYRVKVTNRSTKAAKLTLASYLEWGILEFYRELWWAYLKYHCVFSFDAERRCIKNQYNVYEAAYAPAMLMATTEPVAGFECSRDAFIGKAGSLQTPDALCSKRGFTNSELPLGGHGCGVLGVDVQLAPGASKGMAYMFTMGDNWDQAHALLDKYSKLPAIDAAVEQAKQFWEHRLKTLQTQTGDAMVDRFVNTWNPYQSMVLLSLPASTNTEHMGIDSLRWRDFTQYCLTPGNVDPEFAKFKLGEIWPNQHTSGEGCCYYYPNTNKPPGDEPRRSDNTAWSVYSVKNIVEETGDLSYLEQSYPYREGGSGSVYDHVLRGLKWISDNRGPQGLPLMFYADWNDALGDWRSPQTQSVMLALQFVHSCRQFKQLSDRLGRSADSQWCQNAADEMERILNSPAVWDGKWYARLLLGDGTKVGSHKDRETQIWINPQTWSVISGVGAFEGRGNIAMESVFQRLNSPAGLYKQDPPMGSTGVDSEEARCMRPGVAENGGVFNHTNTWAIIAECLLGHNDRAFEYYRRIIPAVHIERVGADLYEREPFAYVSSVNGPHAGKLFGQGGINWITGTATWMYNAVSQYILGVKPTLDGLSVKPCLPSHLNKVRIARRFRGCMYDIQVDNAARGAWQLEVNGKAIDGTVIPLQKSDTCSVRVRC